MDLSKLSLQELKALAYDQISTIEVSRQNLGAIEAMIKVRQTSAASVQSPNVLDSIKADGK